MEKINIVLRYPRKNDSVAKKLEITQMRARYL